MNPILSALFRLCGMSSARAWDRAADRPRETQENLLLRIARANGNTEYGRACGFASVSGMAEYRRRAPIAHYADLEPYVEKMLRGAARVLTADPPLMFCLTSGTAARPKHVPLTRRGLAGARLLSSQWLYRALRNHPHFLDGSVLCVTGSAEESRAPCGIPCGSVSGAIHRALPAPVRRMFALPESLNDIGDYALRYRLAARFALERTVTFVTTPNPTTLMAIADAGRNAPEALLRAIRDGVPVADPGLTLSPGDAAVVARLARKLKPNPRRARELEDVLTRHGAFRPTAVWPLRLIGCWLGGSVGYHADKLSESLAPGVPLRDLGYLASEGSFTLPVSDHEPAGIPYLDGHVFEFAPDTDGPVPSDADTLLCHELESGAQYRILITNWNGLYRYDIGDIVEARGRYRNAPLLAFVRKERDLFNITGEKLHGNHVIRAFRALREACGARAVRFRAIPDRDRIAYDFMVLFETEPDREEVRRVWLPALDDALQKANIEYAAKRRSGRLRPPRVLLMDPAWPDAVLAAALAEGLRDIQFKWRLMEERASETDRAHLRATLEMEDSP